jgi:membrane protease YdiL (CAAX protease family)
MESEADAVQPASQQPEPAVAEPVAGSWSWPAWPWWLGFVGFFAALLIPMAIGLAVGIGLAVVEPSFDPETLNSNPVLVQAGTVLQDLSFVGAAVVLAWMVARPRAWEFGLRRSASFWTGTGISVLAMAASIAFMIGYSALFQIEDKQSTLDDLGVGKGAVMTFTGVFLIVVVAPLVEEFFFRGFMYRAFRTNLPAWAAALVVGGIFGVVHVFTGVEFIPLLIFFGVVLCLVYEWTGSLYWAIAVHAINNTFALAIDPAAGDPVLPLALGAGLLAALGVAAYFSRPAPSTALSPAPA